MLNFCFRDDCRPYPLMVGLTVETNIPTTISFDSLLHTFPTQLCNYPVPPPVILKAIISSWFLLYLSVFTSTSSHLKMLEHWTFSSKLITLIVLLLETGIHERKIKLNRLLQQHLLHTRKHTRMSQQIRCYSISVNLH